VLQRVCVLRQALPGAGLAAAHAGVQKGGQVC
jgi:hypothetical protein